MLGFGTVLRNDQKHRRTETLIFPIYNENPKTSIIASSQSKIVEKNYISLSESCWEGTVQETMFSVAFCYGTYTFKYFKYIRTGISYYLRDLAVWPALHIFKCLYRSFPSIVEAALVDFERRINVASQQKWYNVGI